MSHLGPRLSALVDGELTPEERDRVHAHLATCTACRTEASALRELKNSMRGLTDVPAADALTRRLVAIGEPGDPVPPRRRAWPGKPAARPAFRTFGVGPAPWQAGTRPRRRHRGRYLAVGVASGVVVGLGVTAFTVGGGQQAPGPRVTPPVQMYSVEHAITTGEVPFGGSSAPGPDLVVPSQQP